MFHLLVEGIRVTCLLPVPLPPAVHRSPSSLPSSKVSLSKDTRVPPLEANWDPEVFQLEMLLLSKDGTLGGRQPWERSLLVCFTDVVSLFSLVSLLFSPLSSSAWSIPPHPAFFWWEVKKKDYIFPLPAKWAFKSSSSWNFSGQVNHLGILMKRRFGLGPSGVWPQIL